MVHWFCLSVQLVTSLLRLIENTGCGIMSVSHTPNQALLRTLVMLNSGLRPSFNITQCSQLGLVDICALWTFTNVTSVKVARPWYNVQCWNPPKIPEQHKQQPPSSNTPNNHWATLAANMLCIYFPFLSIQNCQCSADLRLQLIHFSADSLARPG